MPGKQLRPNGVYSNSYDVINAPDAATALADNNDMTYLHVRSISSVVSLAFEDWAIPPGAVVRNLLISDRLSTDPTYNGGVGTAIFNYNLLLNGSQWGAIGVTPGITGTSPQILPLSSFAGLIDQATVNALGFSFGEGIFGGTSTRARHFELYCDLTYTSPPTVVATGPTGVLTINSPTVSWVHVPGEDAVSGQDYYRVRVYNVATGALAFDTGNVAGAASSAVVGPLPMQAQYRAVVNTMQTTVGVGQWSPDSSTVFTLDVTGPTTDVTGPSGVVGTTSPTVTWTHTPGVGAQTGQTFYRIRGYDTGDLIVPLYDSGVVPSAASSAVVGPLDNVRPWRIVVTTAQTTDGVPQWSTGDYTEFTIDVVPALIASIEPTPIPDRGAISLLITRDTASPMWQAIDVESSYDDGLTWVPVRGATHLSVNGDAWTVIDHEAPNDRNVQYRARASRVSVGETITGPWFVSPLTSWSLVGSDVILVDPDHPERTVRVCLSAAPEPLYGRAVGVFRPVGAQYPVVVSDVLQAPTMSITVVTYTQAESAAFLAVVEAPVLLMQSPARPWGWGSRYVALGQVQQLRTAPTSRKAHRIWLVAMYEVARPADESAT